MVPWKKYFLICGSLLMLTFSFLCYLRAHPVMEKKWSIGVYNGNTPFKLTTPTNLNNPVLTAADVTDIPADFVADPFVVKENLSWYLFFEVKNRRRGRGEIGVAVSEDGRCWTYKQIVLRERFHLSYPDVLKFNGEYYLIPESFHAKSIRLYKAIEFPYQWTYLTTLVKGKFVDPTIFNHEGKWWLFTANPKHKNLYLYYSDSLLGPWTRHPKSPLIKNSHHASPAGRILIHEGRLYRFAQDVLPVYGNQVWAFEITKLTTTEYKEKKVPENPVIKASGSGWNKDGMHTYNLLQLGHDRWFAVVDGFYFEK